MKFLFALLLLPLFSTSQTVHTKDGNILYEGKEKITGVSELEINNRIQHILPSLVDNYQIDKQSANTVRARGELKLKTPNNFFPLKVLTKPATWILCGDNQVRLL